MKNNLTTERILKMLGMRIVFGYLCNYNCKFCYQKDKKNRFNTLPEFIKNMEEVPMQFTPTYITCMGGEPTLDPQLSAKLNYLQTRYPDVPLSFTTNGSGGFMNDYEKAEEKYAELLSNINLNITFSLPTIKNYAATVGKKVDVLAYCIMIENLRIRFPDIIMRINSYILQDEWFEVYMFAKRTNVGLTFCEELRKDNQAVFEGIPLVQQLMKNRILKMERKNRHEMVFTDTDGYQFWNYLHQDHYDYNNLLILPDGTFSEDFGDCVNQLGKLK